MTLKAFLQKVVSRLEKEKIHYALAGGLAASLYRAEERVTRDLDFLFFTEEATLERAQSFVSLFALKPLVARKADLAGGPKFARKRKSTEPMIVIGRRKDSPQAVGLDLILPGMPWASDAVKRAQDNKVDFGFGAIPTATVEDVIIAKLYAISLSSKREKDIDDLRSICEAKHKLDLSYLIPKLATLDLKFPESLREEAVVILKS